MTWLSRLWRSADDLGYVEGWNERRRLDAERVTFKYYGIRETVYGWSKKFQPRGKKLANVRQFDERKRA